MTAGQLLTDQSQQMQTILVTTGALVAAKVASKIRLCKRPPSQITISSVIKTVNNFKYEFLRSRGAWDGRKL